MTKKLFGLYAITNETLMPEKNFLQLAEAAISSGIGVLQYRDKSSDKNKKLQQARALKKICDKYNVIFIINDDLKLAQLVDADGIHIGKNDLSLEQTRSKLGTDKIIGVSCYNRLLLAQNAATAGADYIAFGRFFDSSVKPDAPLANIGLISEFKKDFKTPVCCIGGITSQNHHSLIDGEVNARADMVAVISDIFSSASTQNITKKCKSFIF